MLNSKKQTMFSGVQPSGSLHLGNYLGAIKQWVKLQANHNAIFCIVDYHAMTVPYSPAELKKKVLDTARIYIAAGIDYEKAIIFRQSEVSAHTELAWILNCVARMGDLNKMTQFKDKAGSQAETASVGLYTYPVLMAADILLYDTDVVPVGEDQTQHIELARDLARRFNKRFGETFRVPKAMIEKQGARIMGLDNPFKKMSKSAPNPANYVALTDKPEEARQKIIRAVTDSGNEIKFNPEKKPAISNLLTIHSLLSKKPISELEEYYDGFDYKNFKAEVASLVVEFLTDFRFKFLQLKDQNIETILQKGKSRAKLIADQKLLEIKEKIGA